MIPQCRRQSGLLEASDTSADLGLDVRLGVSYRVESNWVAFFEYHFTHVSPSFEINRFGGRTSGDTTFNTSRFLLGLPYRFEHVGRRRPTVYLAWCQPRLNAGAWRNWQPPRT